MEELIIDNSKTMSQQVAQVLGFYIQDPVNRRSVNRSKCYYSPANLSPGCFVGVFIEDKSLCNKLDASSNIIGCLAEEFYDEMPLVILDNLDLFSDLQQVHDNGTGAYWSAEKVWTGQQALRKLIDRHDILDAKDFVEYLK